MTRFSPARFYPARFYPARFYPARFSRTGAPLAAYAAPSDGTLPTALWDFQNGVYALDSLTTLPMLNALAIGNTSPKTVLDDDGSLKWAGMNLFIDSSTPATQTISITSGVQYTVEVEGTGSIALSDAGSGTATEGSPVTFTASTASLTCTVSGTVTRPRVYRSYLGGMQLYSGSTYVPTGGSPVYLPGINHDASGTRLGTRIFGARTNLLLNSAALATQSVTVAAVPHVIHFTGTGSITLSGVGSGTLTGTGTGEANRVSLAFTPTAGSLTVTVSGTVTNAQLEVGAGKSPYIPTSGAAVTRNTDDLTQLISAISGFSATEGTLVVEWEGEFSAWQRAITIHDGSENNRVTVYRTSTGLINHTVHVGGVGQASLGPLSDTGSGPFISAFTWKENDFAVSVNGSGALLDSSGTLPSLTAITFGASSSGGNSLNGTIAKIIIYPKRLPDSDLVALST